MEQLALRPYVTAGIAVVGVGMIAITPVAPVLPMTLPSASAVSPAVALTTSYAELFDNTMANLTNISSNADMSAISQVFTALFTNPLGVIGAFTNMTPDVTTDITSLPATVSVQLPPGLELLIANLGSQAATMNAVHGVLSNLSDPTTLLNAPATILNAYLNGEDNLSLLGGIINIPVFNGILAPEQDLGIDLNLIQLLDALGLGNLDLSNLNVNGLLDQLGLGNLTLGSLLGELGISGDGLGDLLKVGSNVTDLGGLLSFLGLGDLGLGSLSLTNVLSGLGLDANVNLNSLGLDQILSAFGLNPDINLGLGTLLTDLGFGSLVNSSLGTLLDGLPGGVLTGITGALNGILGPLLGPLTSIPGVSVLLGTLGLNLNSLLTPNDLLNALNGVTVDDLLGGQTLHQTVAGILGSLGVVNPGDLTIGGILGDLGFSDSTGDLTLSGLLGGLGGGLLNFDITGLLNGIDLGGLVSGLGLDGLPLNLGDLVGDLSNLNLADLLGDLGLGNLDLANISVGSFGGMMTLLVDTVPQQILDALGTI